MRSLPFGLLLLVATAAGPAIAQGVPGGTVGLTSTELPANPFASNYPSEPPSAQIRRERRYERDRGGQTRRRGTQTHGLRPPADIPRAGTSQ